MKSRSETCPPPARPGSGARQTQVPQAVQQQVGGRGSSATPERKAGSTAVRRDETEFRSYRHPAPRTLPLPRRLLADVAKFARSTHPKSPLSDAIFACKINGFCHAALFLP